MKTFLDFFKKLSPDTLVAILVYIFISNSVLFFAPTEMVQGNVILLYIVNIITNVLVLFYFQHLSLKHSLFKDNTYLPSWILILIISGNTFIYNLPFLNLIILVFILTIDLILQMQGQKRNINSLFFLGVITALLSLFNIGLLLLFVWMIYVIYIVSSLSFKNIITFFISFIITLSIVFSFAYLFNLSENLLNHINATFVKPTLLLNKYSIIYLLILTLLYFLLDYSINTSKQRSLSKVLLFIVIFTPLYWILQIKGFVYILWFAKIIMGIYTAHLLLNPSNKKWILIVYLGLLIIVFYSQLSLVL